MQMRSTQENIGADNVFTISESMIWLYLHCNSQAVLCVIQPKQDKSNIYPLF